MMIGWKKYVVVEFSVLIEISMTVEISTNIEISVFQREIGDNKKNSWKFLNYLNTLMKFLGKILVRLN